MNNQTNTATQAQVSLPPEAVLTNIAFGALTTQALYVAAKLGIADQLADGNKSTAELSAVTDTDERSLYRVLRSLAGNGIFEEVSSKVFANTAISEALRADAPNSMRNGVVFMGETWHFNVWGNLMHSVRTGKSAWGKTHGAEVFDWFAEKSEEAEIFNDAMTDMSVSIAPKVVESYDFSDIELLADIAGGHGYLLAQILKSNPKLNGILFDVAPVIAGSGALLEKEGVTDRVEAVAGDFFKEVPGADGYIMKHIIHDWDDERCVNILKNIHNAMKENGKVLIVETVVPEGNEPHYSKLLDLEMLASPGGIERTAQEYRELLGKSGFRLTKIVPTKSPFSIIEAVKA
ncbi:MAG: acetylserotonin O-methyltransferase [Acidobacteriota bacterium]|nr:acetylserotonin O-methyltransferase [Acidobacteriota bacterium]